MVRKDKKPTLTFLQHSQRLRIKEEDLGTTMKEISLHLPLFSVSNVKCYYGPTMVEALNFVGIFT